jgi:anaerobic ribonucleoside-triphosphate reductase activating protein
MLRYLNYNIVFQEVPDEVTLAIHISQCPHRCKGCHSPILQQNSGEYLTERVLEHLLDTYKNAITCICFMGGDANPKEIEKLAQYIKNHSNIKTAWYSGNTKFPEYCSIQYFNFIKLGPYIDALGGLNAITTNQKFYVVNNRELVDITARFQLVTKRHSMYEVVE